MADELAQRVAALDWNAAENGLRDFGYAVTAPLLTAAECAELISMYHEDSRFRNRVDMARHNFGSGEYKYFGRPLPAMVDELRLTLYPRLEPLASEWAQRLRGQAFPGTLPEFLEVCTAAGQTRPTPLLLRYRAGDFNCLHQDLYGEIAFPLQVTLALSRRELDYTGGEFLLLEQRPRAQSRGQAVPLEQGQAVVFATRYRPVQGTRGSYRVNLRHGVSRLLSGERYTLGIIFHDAH